MRCTITKEEIVTVDVREVANKVSEKGEMKHDVPPTLLNDLQRAHLHLKAAQDAVVKHLHETDQPEPTWR